MKAIMLLLALCLLGGCDKAEVSRTRLLGRVRDVRIVNGGYGSMTRTQIVTDSAVVSTNGVIKLLPLGVEAWLGVDRTGDRWIVVDGFSYRVD